MKFVDRYVVSTKDTKRARYVKALALRQQKLSWGRIAHELGVTAATAKKYAAMAALAFSVSAVGAQTYCIKPPVPCAQVALTSWVFVAEAAQPHYIHVVANGHDFGRVAAGTAYNVPASTIVTDAIFSGKFDGP